MSTYLELVNAAIEESGQDLDALTTGNFDTPPTKMGERWKTWTKESWKEIQMLRDDWDFKTGRASVFIQPAIYVEQGSRSVAPPTDSVFIGNDTGYQISVDSVNLISGTWLGGDAKATLYFTIDDGSTAADFKFNELFDEVSPTPANTDVFRCKGWGRFNFVQDGQLPDLVEVHIPSVMVQTTGGSSIQPNESDAGLDTVHYMDWAKWLTSVERFAGSRGKPNWFTITPDGDLDFYPRPDEQYVVHFTYTKALSTLSAFDDTPAELPSEYHDAIMWRTVMFYADYNNQFGMLARATKRYDFYKRRMEKRLMPVVGFARSVYDGC